MRPVLAYSPRHGLLGDAGAFAATVYLGSFAGIAFAFSSPIVLAGAAAAVVVAGVASSSGRALAASARWGIGLAILIIAVNVLAAQRGDTILVRGFDLPVLGQLDVSGEALIEGAVLALRVVIVLMAFAVHSARVDPDRLLRLLRPIARRSALTATLVVRMVPLATADQARLREAAALRGPAAAPVGRAAMARRLLAGSLDRAVEAAATLELRGYALGAPRSAGALIGSRHDPLLIAVGVSVVALGAVALVSGVGGFDPYPTVALDSGAATIALALTLPALAALPFIVARGTT